MRPVSDRWADGITSSGQLAVEVYPLSDPDNKLPLTAGSVTLDITAEVRGRCDLSFESPELIPTDADSLLAPYDTELQVARGLVYPDGERELVSLGIFRPEEVEIEESGQGVQIKVQGLDRSQRIIDASFEDPYVIEGGTDYLEAMRVGLAQAYPEIAFNFIERTHLTPTLNGEEGDNRWQFFSDMAEAIGCELYFDNDGKSALRPIATTHVDPVAEIIEGAEGVTVASLLSATKQWSRTDTHNRWIVTGDNPDTEGEPPRAVATDDDPASPTRYGGPFGRKPDFYSSSFITTPEQAADAAAGRKAKEMGTSQTINFGALVNPALEPGDVVHAKRTHTHEGELIVIADERHILDSLTIPLAAADSMNGATRALRVR